MRSNLLVVLLRHRYIESKQHSYADDDWLEPDTNEGAAGVIRLDGDGEEVLSPGAIGEKNAL
ncbi:hypothetical protein [Litoribacillus peritrichatus]|uniref:hypothetical protein n=1 Tax=Litoribacillus peritrichatus TaxID=718191 RepID=UPI0031E21998